MTKLRTWRGPVAPILIGLGVFAAMFAGSELLDRSGRDDRSAGSSRPRADGAGTGQVEEALIGPGVAPASTIDPSLPAKPIPGLSGAAAVPTAASPAGPTGTGTGTGVPAPTATTPGPVPPVATTGTTPAPLATTTNPVVPPPALPTDDLATPPGKPVPPGLEPPGLAVIRLGALCEDFGEFTVTDAGQLVICIATADDAEYRWRLA